MIRDSEIKNRFRRQVFHVTELPTDLVTELANVKISAKHEYLNELLDEDVDETISSPCTECGEKMSRK